MNEELNERKNSAFIYIQKLNAQLEQHLMMHFKGYEAENAGYIMLQEAKAL